MRRDTQKSLKSFSIELVIYGFLIAAYLVLVLRFLDSRLQALHDRSKVGYAFAALGLIVGQGILLDLATTAIFRWIRARFG